MVLLEARVARDSLSGYVVARHEHDYPAVVPAGPSDSRQFSNKSRVAP
jgi:hypothetical protein